MNDRKNAMLTTEDRRWLTGEKSYEGEHAKQQRYQRRRDIRNRVKNAILDFTVVFEHLEESEREKLFHQLNEDQGGDLEAEEFIDGLRDALAFILYNTGITQSMVEDENEQSDSIADQLLQDALYQAGKQDDILVENIELDMKATQMPLSAVLSDLEEGRKISPAGLRLLMESEKVDTTKVQDCIREVMFNDE